MVVPKESLERVLSMGSSIDLQQMLAAGIDSPELPAELQTAVAAQQLAMMGLGQSQSGTTPDIVMGETEDASAEGDMEEVSLFSPTGPREPGRVATGNGTGAMGTPFGLAKFQPLLSSSPGARTWDSTAQDRLRKYEDTLLELNTMFKARYLDFDRCVIMATRTPHATDGSSFSFPNTPTTAGTPQSPSSPTSPTALGPLNASELVAFCASLGVPVTLEKASILVSGGFARRNGGGNDVSTDEDSGPSVRVGKLRKDMRVAIARSLRPTRGRGNGNVPRIHSAPAAISTMAVSSEGEATVGADQSRSPRRRLRPIVARPGTARAILGARTHSLSPQQVSVVSPKAGKSRRYMGPSPPAIRESEEGDDEEWEESDQEVPAGELDGDQELPTSPSSAPPFSARSQLSRERGSRNDRTLAWKAMKRYNNRQQQRTIRHQSVKSL